MLPQWFRIASVIGMLLGYVLFGGGAGGFVLGLIVSAIRTDIMGFAPFEILGLAESAIAGGLLAMAAIGGALLLAVSLIVEIVQLIARRRAPSTALATR